jgi:DNA modification methylase
MLLFPSTGLDAKAAQVDAELAAAERDLAIAKSRVASATMHRWRAGRLLQEIEPTIPHGQWIKWLKRRYPAYTPRRLQQFKQVAEYLPTEAKAKESSHLGIDGILEEIQREARRKRRTASSGDFTRGTITNLVGDCRVRLKELADGIAHCCITSPPYFQNRDYGGPSLIWGGRPDCEHQWKKERNRLWETPNWKSYRQGWCDEDCFAEHATCEKCGAWRGQLGHEPTVALYVEHIVEAFREVRRVLRDDGTLWIVIGDSYDGSRRNHGVAWRIAFALEEDGWILRDALIWHKTYCKPETVRKRCCRNHEHIFMFSKSADYYYDIDAIKEPAISIDDPRKGKRILYGGKCQGEARTGERSFVSIPSETRIRRTVWSIAPQPFRGGHYAAFPEALVEPMILAGCPVGGTVLDPFGGVATTGLVAEKRGRNAIVIEVSSEYAGLAKHRLARRKSKAG